MNYAEYGDYESRTAGYGKKLHTIQAWKTTKPPEPQNDPLVGILTTLEEAKKGEAARFDQTLKTAMSYAPQQKTALAEPEDGFKFSDIIDMINPLHHLPFVGMAYRGMTGDELKPMSHVVGGALYGGPVGAITGSMNAITQFQTGQDIGDHMLEFAGLKTEFSSKEAATIYAKANLDSMTPPEKIKTLVLNS